MLTVLWLVAVPAMPGVQKGSQDNALALVSWFVKQI